MAVAGCSDDGNNNPAGPPVTLELQSGNFAAGTYSHMFAAPGTFNYQCTLHPSQMNGTVTVSDAAPVADSVAFVGIPGTSFTNGNPTIRTGGRVAWTNTSGNTHNVTSTN